MYHRIKNTLAGLAMVAAFLAAGALLSEPLPAQGEPQAVAPATMDAGSNREVIAALAFARVMLQAAEQQAAAVAERDQAAGTTSRGGRGSRLKRELGMPYYSFGAMLPRRGES